MNDAVIRLGNYSLYGFGILATFSFLWGSFVFYKRAIMSHFEELHILDAVVVSAFWAFISGRLFYVLFNWHIFWNHIPRIFLFSNFPGIDRWGVLVGIFLGVFWTVRKLKGKVVDWFDPLSLGILAGHSIFFGGVAIMTGSWQFGISSLLFLVAFLLFWGLEDRYRTFAWYKANKTSARSGLIFGFTVTIVGLLYLIENILQKKLGTVNGVWSLVLFVAGIAIVYIRSGRTVSDDLKIIFKNGRKK